jgi:pheromone shutdown protein TraB
MPDTILIELTNKKAVKLLHDMEDLKLIKVLKENIGLKSSKTKLSDKYRGIITKEQGRNLNEHIQQMRSEWNNI